MPGVVVFLRLHLPMRLKMEIADYQQNLCKTLCKIMRSRLKVYATLAVITR